MNLSPEEGVLRIGEICWCDEADGMVPPGAVVGGKDGEPLYVGRAYHEGALLPGKVKPRDNVCYVAWGGREHPKSEYEVNITKRFNSYFLLFLKKLQSVNNYNLYYLSRFSVIVILHGCK